MNVPQRLVEAIEQSPSIIVTTHVQPDGDAIGSMLGLKHALESAGKMVIAVLSDEVPANLRFLPGADEIMAGDCAAAAGQHALAVVLDCGSLDRVGRCAGAVQASGLMANVDHHPTNTGFADINWVDVAAASTSEMVFGLLERMGIALGPETATCLLAGVITDTGSFSTQHHGLHVSCGRRPHRGGGKPLADKPERVRHQVVPVPCGHGRGDTQHGIPLLRSDGVHGHHR